MDSGDLPHFSSSARNRTASMDFGGQIPLSKRGRSGSISGRLRAASDLEEIGWIDKNQKGVIKDLIISGDQTLRNALDKYENGDAGDLEVLIQRGMLSRRQSLDLLDGLDMDFLTVGYEGNSQISGGVDGCSNGFSYEDDFFFDQQFEERSGSIGQDNDPEGIAYNQDIFRMGGTLSDPSSSSWGSNNSRSRRTSSIGISLGAGSFDIGGAFFEGLGGNILPPSSRKHSLSLPPTAGTPRSGFIHGLGSGGDVEMSAYKSMAASLEAQAQGQGHQRNGEGRTGSKASTSSTTAHHTATAALSAASSSSLKSKEASKGQTVKTVSPATIPKKTSANLTQGAKAEGESRGHTGNTNSSVSSSQVQRGGRFSSGPTPGSAIDTHSQHQQQMDRDFYSQQQQQLQQQHQLQHQRQQQLAEMQHNLMARQMQLSGGRQQQNPILSHPHGHIHASHSHTHYATPQYDQAAFFQAQGQGQGPHQNTVQKGLGQMQVGQSSSRMFDDNNMTTGAALLKSEREAGQYAGGILSSLYNPDGTLCDAASLPLGGRGYVGAYSPEARRERIERFLAKRDKRVWTKKVKYDVRKNFADSRLRVKGRFVKKEDEELMKELLSI